MQFFTFAKQSKQSVILHINTKKGMGYLPAMNDKEGKWHGVGPFDVESGEVYSNHLPNHISWSEAYSVLLREEISKHSNIKLVSPATLLGSSLDELHKAYPNNVIDVGINEEHALVMSASMARNGLIPIVSIYSTFLQRAYDYLNNDIARVDSHVILLIDRSGLVGGDGSTHQGIFDVSFMNALPNMQIAMASNIEEAKGLLSYAIAEKHPIAIRFPKCDVLNKDIVEAEEIKEPKWKIVNEIKDINILTYGDFVNDYIEEKEYGLINALFIKPLDLDVLQALDGKKLVVVEEVIKSGSLASAILNKISDLGLNITLKSFAIDDCYPYVATRAELIKDFKLDKESILKYIKNIF